MERVAAARLAARPQGRIAPPRGLEPLPPRLEDACAADYATAVLVPPAGVEPALNSLSSCCLCQLGYKGAWHGDKDSNLDSLSQNQAACLLADPRTVVAVARFELAVSSVWGWRALRCSAPR